MDRTVRGMTFTGKLLTSQPPIEADGRRFKRYYVTTESARITAEVERWQGVKVPDFVAVFAARRVRAQLKHDAAVYGGSVA